MIEFFDGQGVLGQVIRDDDDLKPDAVIADFVDKWSDSAEAFETFYADWSNGYVSSRRVADNLTASIFVEVQHPRDSEGKFTEKADTPSTGAGTLKGRLALGAAPTEVGLVRLRNTNPQLIWREGHQAPKWSEASKREHFNALSAYRGAAYRAVNKHLRGKITDAELMHPDVVEETSPVAPNKVAPLIDDVMEHSKLTHDVVVYRGSATGRGIFGDRLKGDLTGFAWQEHGYSSTSANEDVALMDFGGGGVLMRIVAPAGTGAIQLSPWDAKPGEIDEAELLFERGLKYRIVADYGIDGNTRRLDVEIYND